MSVYEPLLDGTILLFPVALRELPNLFLSLTLAMRLPNCIARFTNVEHSCDEISQNRRTTRAASHHMRLSP